VLAVTGRGSHKGHRYAIARVKPYQGQRSSARRPKNWEFLRGLLEAHPLARLVLDREADDVMAEYTSGAVGEVFGPAVILTQDKDMRMLTGCWHMNWETHGMLFVPAGTFELVHNDKVYGPKWFLLQLLQGDTADNIPGLPFYCDGSFYAKGHPEAGQFRKLRIGEKGAQDVLAKVNNFDDGLFAVRQLYTSYYGDRADLQLGEQAALLWMRTSPEAHWSEGPLRVGCNEATIDELFTRAQCLVPETA
jgi:DNA polymerase-1